MSSLNFGMGIFDGPPDEMPERRFDMPDRPLYPPDEEDAPDEIECVGCGDVIHYGDSHECVLGRQCDLCDETFGYWCRK